MKKICLILLPFLLLAGCTAQEPTVTSAFQGERVFPGRDVNMAWDARGGLHAVYVEDGARGARVVYRRLDEPGLASVVLSPPGVNTNAGGETPPVLQILPNGTLVAAYTVPLPGQWRSQILVQRSHDGGATWSVPTALPNRGDPGSQNQFSATASGSRLVFAWLESRNGVRGLRAARTSDGARFEPDLAVDEKACQCCGTELLAGRSEEVWLAYRDLGEENVRDIQLAASRDGGASFDAPHPVSEDGWKLAGCPDRGPRLAQAEDGSLWAAWFTGEQPGVYAAVSQDGGKTFGPRQPIVTLGGDVRNAMHPEIGILPDGRIAALYEVFRAPQAHQVEARVKSSAGTDWGSQVIVEPDASSPRLAVQGKNAAVAFIRQKGEASEIVVRDWERVFQPAG